MAAPRRPPPDPWFVLRGAQSAVHALHFCEGPQGPGHPLLLSGLPRTPGCPLGTGPSSWSPKHTGGVCQLQTGPPAMPRPAQPPGAPKSAPSAASCRPDRSLRGLVHVWSLRTRRTVATLDGHGGQCVTWLQTLLPGQQLLSQGRDLQLCLWDVAEGRNTLLDTIALESVGFCRSSVLADGRPRWLLAVPGKDHDEVRVLEMPSKTPVCALRTEAGTRPGMPMSLRLWQADTRLLLLAGYEDGSVALWSVPERRALSRAACHPEPVLGLDFDPYGARGVSGSAGKALAVWSLDEQQALKGVLCTGAGVLRCWRV